LLTAIRRVFGPTVGDGARLVDRMLGGRAAVRRRLDALGSGLTVEDFRVEQVVWGALGLLGAALVATVGSVAAGGVNVLSAGLLCLAGVLGGVLGRDWWLTQQVQKREELLLAEFPVVAELLALAVTAGESPTAAIARVTRLSRGELAQELGAALGRARAGVPLVDALQQVADRTSLDALARFVDGLLVAIERGTPLAEVLRAQAADVREAGKRRLLEAGGRKEIAMMVPVVFLVLPVTVLFALFPGLISIVSLAQ
jgi:tight adherence protein C